MNDLYLKHHGIKGMKWGVRRYQNPDGSLTAAGRARYAYSSDRGETVYLTRNDDTKSYTISRASSTNKMDMAEDVVRQVEKNIEEMVVSAYMDNRLVPVSKVDKYIENHPKLIENINWTIDDAMNQYLNSVLDAVDKEAAKKAFETPKSESKKTKPKYSQEQAISKVYDDLEKKYSNFDSFDQDKQDELFWEYANESGLYKYI